MHQKDVGREVDVHISRGSGVFDEAVPDEWMVPRIVVGVGVALGIAGVVGIVRRLRSVPVAAGSTGRPWPQVD